MVARTFLTLTPPPYKLHKNGLLCSVPDQKKGDGGPRGFFFSSFLVFFHLLLPFPFPVFTTLPGNHV